ncbi:hypothetical protein [Embleya scabrispora]|uniref:hypothetical protein n=1 Tax=Embleya scabrispora TaxID=159449 RepID=UPI00037194AC|nr:hypothetical protein [Embleya scabrispora]MYS85069.1 hypothetical protein [Streptomyces sp. SID5474]
MQEQAGVAEPAAAVLGSTAAAALDRQLYERSAGLPPAVEEDLRVLEERLAATGGSVSAAALEHVGVPRALQEVIGSRVHELPRPAVAIVRAAAVLAVPGTRSCSPG